VQDGHSHQEAEEDNQGGGVGEWGGGGGGVDALGGEHELGDLSDYGREGDGGVLSAGEKERVGRCCKRLIDFGRVLYVREAYILRSTLIIIGVLISGV
jgi:hypothetical protein